MAVSVSLLRLRGPEHKTSALQKALVFIYDIQEPVRSPPYFSPQKRATSEVSVSTREGL